MFAAPWFGRLHEFRLSGCPLGTADIFDGAGLRALAEARLPHLTSLTLNDAYLMPADVSGMLSSAPWLATLTSLSLKKNCLSAPGHRALSQLHLPRLRDLSLDCNRLNGEGPAVLSSVPWLTQLARLGLTELWFTSRRGRENILAAIEDDAGAFGRLRRLGCATDADMSDRFLPRYPGGGWGCEGICSGPSPSASRLAPPLPPPDPPSPIGFRAPVAWRAMFGCTRTPATPVTCWMPHRSHKTLGPHSFRALAIYLHIVGGLQTPRGP